MVALKEYLDALANLAAADFGTKFVAGRARHPVVRLPGIPFELIMKKNIRGGLLGKISAERKSLRSAITELENSRRARAMSLPASNVIGAARIPRGVFSIVEFIPGCKSLLEKQCGAPAVSQFLRLFHGKNVYHRDLNSSNILFSSAGLLMADCSGLVFRNDESRRLELAGFAKLYRHLRKNIGKDASEKFVQELLQNYFPEKSEADSAMRHCRRSVTFHLT